MKVDFYHYNVQETINWENIWKRLRNFGIDAQFIVEPPGKNTSGTISWDGYERVIQYMEENNYPYENAKRCEDADAVITTQTADWLNCYSGIKINTLYGSTLTLDCWGYSPKKLVGFDGILVHGEYSKHRLISNGIPSTKIAVMGFPKYTDFYRDRLDHEAYVLNFDLNPHKKTIVYLPSWHQNSSLDQFLGVIEELRAEYNVLIKPHHNNFELESERIRKLKSLTDVIVYDKPISAVPFYLVSDLVLADTRSGAFAEGILTNSKLIGLHNRDNKAADFVEPIIYQIAPICENAEELLDTVYHLMTSKSDDFQELKGFLKNYLFANLQGQDDSVAAHAIIDMVKKFRRKTNSFGHKTKSVHFSRDAQTNNLSETDPKFDPHELDSLFSGEADRSKIGRTKAAKKSQKDSVLEKIIPPEIIDDEFYYIIQKLAQVEEIETVLEIGSSAGEGSTKALVSGLKNNPQKPKLFCMEISKSRYAKLQNRYKNESFIKCFHISSVSIAKFATENRVIQFYNTKASTLNDYPLDDVLCWLRQDISYLKNSGVAEDGIQKIKKDYNISHFGLVLIDGSEFTGEAELDEIYGAKIIMLDDINAFKNYSNYIRLMNDPGYNLVCENHELRNGYAIFRRNIEELPIHFFTIVLNGQPFIRHHIEIFKKLPLDWHWHIIEGVADLKHDTSWSLKFGGHISDEFHQNGLSNDGTTEYLDYLAKQYPDKITIYRKPKGVYWDGKLEMVNAPLTNIKGDCLLWQIDTDELWTTEQICTMQALFKQNPEKTSAFFHCHFFVGPELVTITPNSYSHNNQYEWLRVWRYKPEMKWFSHEPPRLAKPHNNGWMDISRVNPFMHEETLEKGLVFTHYAYSLESQLRFKEKYYGYSGAVNQWRELNNVTTFPVFLRDYFKWVKDDTQVDKIERRTLGADIEPVKWNFQSLEPCKKSKEISLKPIVIDGVIFQLQAGRSLGISRVWSNLIPELAKVLQDYPIFLLKRGSFTAGIESIREYGVPLYRSDSEAEMDNDDEMLGKVCKELNAAIFLSTYFTRAPGIRNILLVHDMIPEIMGFDLTLPSWRSKVRAIENANAFIAVSNSTSKDLQSFHKNIPSQKVTVAYNGVSPEFYPSAHSEIKKFVQKFKILRPYFLLVGNRNGYKNCEAFFYAFSRMKQKHELQIVAVGGESFLTPTEEHYSRDINITFLPWIDDSDLRAAYSGALALIYPSRYEGFGLPILEASACGCPVITTPYASIPEVGGNAAIYINPDSVEAILDALDQVTKTDVRNRMIELGVKHAKKFKWSEMAKHFSNVISNETKNEPRRNLACENRQSLDEMNRVSRLPVKDGQVQVINQTKVQSYYQPPAGNTEKYINLKPVKIFDGLISSFNCLKDYHINEFGSGFKAAEAILHHIVTNKLNGSFKKKNDLWNKTVVVQLGCEIFATKNGRTFAELKPTTVEDIHPEFGATEGPNRLAGIHAYAESFSKREDVVPPLYVTGAVLNELGADIDPKMLFMMDGARRIAAAALTHRHTINVYLLMCEVEYAQLINEEYLQRLSNQIKKIQWFDRYQTIPLVGLQGQRSLKRFDLIDMSVLQDHTVMDFGCNLGQSCIKAVQAGAKEVVGVEGMHDTYVVACQIGETMGFSNLHYLNVDFNDFDFDRQIEEYYPHKIDYSFFLSVYRTKELTQRERLFRYIINKTSRGIFFEGHAHPQIDTVQYYDWLFGCFKLDYRLLGYSEGNLRPLFFCPIATHSIDQQIPKRPTITCTRPKKDPSFEHQFIVSAIVSTYESEKFIEGKIQDLLNQTISDQLEIIIIDSNSPEDEKAIVAKYTQTHKNIKYIRTEKRESVYKAWNRGIKEANGKYITNANVDDRLRPDAFEILVDELNRTPDVALVYGDFFITNCENQDFYNHVCCGYSKKPDYSPDIMLSGCHMGPQPMWRKYIHDEIGYFDENFQSAGDYEFWCRLATKYSMKHIRKFIGLYYHNPRGIVNRAQNKNNHETVLVKEKYQNKFPTHTGKTPSGYYYKDHVNSECYVNICMVTYNRLDFTKQAIESILKYTRYPHVITVVDNASQDGTQEYLTDLKREGIIKNLILLDENIGVAKASNLAWQQEPTAAYYLKYDNDIVIQKQDWLMNMVEVVDSIPELGAIGYNFEPSSYPVEDVNGHQIRIKRDANIGGACYLIPKRVENKLGYWCEDYGLYGEEDGDYSLRLRLAGYYNAYMEDENIGVHLPGGKAALIDSSSKRSISPQELKKEYEYRTWKDNRRQELQKPWGILQRNVEAYYNGIRSLFVSRGVFLGKLDSNIQVFDQDGYFLFLPVSMHSGDSQLEKIRRWLCENNLGDPEIETYIEKGMEFSRIKKTSFKTDSVIKLENPITSSSATETKTEKTNPTQADQIKLNTPPASVTASIIIPVYNRWEYTQNCLNALYEVTDIQGGFEVIVVDNASTDDTQPFLKEVKEKYPNFSFIRNQSNLGFAEACNQGAECSCGYYLVFLNNDTLPQPGWLDEMIKTAEKDPQVGMVGSRLLYPDGTIQHAGVYFNDYRIPYHAFRSAPGNHPTILVSRETPAVTGACMLMPKQLFQHIGGFNEEYHMYVEDVDLCLRTWDAGFKVVYCSESVLTHFESASITDVNYRDAQVRKAWNHLHKSWRDRWPTVLQGLTHENTSPRIDPNSALKRNGNSLKESKVLWHAPIFEPSGYAEEARNFILQLQALNIKAAVREIGRRSDMFRNGLDERSRGRLDEAIEQAMPEDFIHIIQFPAYSFERNPHARYHIGRTMFETDSLPAEWVKKCNLMDEVWVPSEFNKQTFKAAGVTTKLFKVPAGVDSQRYRPGLDVFEIPGTRGVVFLSIFEWIYRKGWDVLLKSWAKAFQADDGVCLVLRTYPINSTDGIRTKKEIEQRIDRFLEVELQKGRNQVAPIIVLADQLNDEDMPHLYASVNAYVLPSRGEGWGRTQMEAMACGLPVLSTRWSGNLEFMTDHNSLLIDVNGLAVVDERAEIPFYRGQKWAEPSVEHLSALMRRVVENRDEMQRIGRAARLDIERYWRWERVAAIAAKRLQAINTELKHRPVTKCGSHAAHKVMWEGSQFVHHSLALVNREICIELARRQDIDLSLIPYEPHGFGPEEDPERFGLIEERLHEPLSGPADFHVRHQWPPNFTPPSEGHWIMIQPWEFGALPKDWLEPLRSEVDEIWAYTTYVRNVYINSGIPSVKVHVIPLGIHHDRFHPAALPLDLNTKKRFKFLFVGGTIRRKGIDVLLSAYTQAFSSTDDVCLVIKDMGGESFYRGQNAAQIIEDVKKNPAAPEILYLTETLNQDQIAGLYTTCNCLAHPYRGEGFGLPVAEAMACGLPVIVTKGGACDDFCSEETAYLVDSKVIPVHMDGYELSAKGWLLEPDKTQLIDTLRFLYEHPDQAKEKGAVAARQIRETMNWKKSTDLIMERFRALKSKPVLRFAGSVDSRAAQGGKAPQEIYETIQQTMQHKRNEDVINELERLVESYPNFALAYNDLGVLYYNAGEKENALKFYERAVQLDPGNLTFQKNLADFYYVEMGRVEDALRIYVKILESNPEDIETLLITGHISVALKKFQDARVFYSRVLEIEPGHRDALQFLDKLNSMKNDNSETQTPEVLYNEIHSLLNNGDPYRAIVELERLLENFPDFGMAHNDLGVLWYRMGSNQKALQHYESAVELMPDNLSFQKNLADFYCIELGQIEDALKIYVSILETHPQDIEALIATGQISIAMQQLDDAKFFFQRVLEIEPWNEEARQQLEKCEESRASEIDGFETPESLYQGLITCLNELTQEDAISQFEKLVRSYPDFAPGHNDLGVLNYQAGNKENALYHYQRAAQLEPENITFQKNLADFVFVDLGNVQEAFQIYRKILDINPDDLETLLISGHICVALKKLDEAKDFYDRVLSLDPGNEDARNNLNAINKHLADSTLSLQNPPKSPVAVVNESDLNSSKLSEADNKNRDQNITASIVIHLNAIKSRLKACLKSIQRHTTEPHEVFLVDSGTTKGTLNWAQHLVKEKPNYQLISSETNASWIQSYNQAMTSASGKFIVIVHNDVIVSQGWLSALIACSNSMSNIGIVGPMFNQAEGIQQVKDTADISNSDFDSYAGAFYQRNQHRRVPTRKLASACIMFTSELIQNIGGFSEQFDSEDVILEDFCNRAASAGYQNMIAADVIVYHENRHKQKANISKKTIYDDKKRFKQFWNSLVNGKPEAQAFQTVKLLHSADEMRQKGKIDQAVEVLLDGIGAYPNERRLYLVLGEILISAKRFQDANDALREMPENEDVNLQNEAQIMEHKELTTVAGISTASSVEDLVIKRNELMGYADEGLENLERAQTYVDRVLSIKPGSACALNLKGILAYRRNDRKAAEHFFEQAMESDPGYGEPCTNLGILNLEADQLEDALKLFEKGFILSPADLDIATNYHSVVNETGDYKRPEFLTREAAGLYPHNQKVSYMLIDFLIQQEKYPEAMAEIEVAIVKFGIEDGILSAALQIREKLGPVRIQKKQKRPVVSLCMIVKDEEKNLAKCLSSVKPIVDEMIVVDTGSTDSTKKIATAFGAKVYDFDWAGDFSEARNYSIAKADGSWIFILDADEVLSPFDYQKFRNIVSEPPKTPIAYSITTRNYNTLPNMVGWIPNDGKYPEEEAASGWLPSTKVRLFYGKEQIWFEGAVHEMVDPVLKRNGIRIKRCSIPIHHYGRLDRENVNRKGQVYFDIGKRKLDEMGDDANALRELAVQATNLVKNEDALELWQRLLSLNPPPRLAAEAFINMGTIYNRLEKFQDALAVSKKAVENAPELKEALYNYAMAELHSGNAQKTIDVLEGFLTRMPDYPPAQFILTAAYCCTGCQEKGRNGLNELKATSWGPVLGQSCVELANGLLRAHRVEFALMLLSTTIECDIVNTEIMNLFAECVKLRDETNGGAVNISTPSDPNHQIPTENLRNSSLYQSRL